MIASQAMTVLGFWRPKAADQIAQEAAFSEGVIIMRSIGVVFVIAAFFVAATASAQQSDQEKQQETEKQQEIERLGAKFLLRQEIQSLGVKYGDYFDKQDAAGIAGLFTKDGILVSATGVAAGTQAIEQHYPNLFKMGTERRQLTLDEVSPLGSDAAIGRGEYHVTRQYQKGKAEGHWAAVYVREGGKWKVRLLTIVPNAADAKQ